MAKETPDKPSPKSAREIAENPLRARPPRVPVSYSGRGGTAAGARVPWESPGIANSPRGRQLPPGGRDISHAQAAGSTGGTGQAHATGASIAAATGDASGQAGTSILESGGTLAPLELEATAEVRDPPLPRFRAKDVIAASSWTGRRTLRDQVLVVEAFGSTALEGVHLLAAAIEERRFNDPATQEALEALKELHQALGELIARAEQSKPMTAVWKRIERSKERVTNAVWDGAQVMLVAPTLAVGTATILSVLSGFPVTEGMVTALCATGMGKDAILTLAKRR